LVTDRGIAFENFEANGLPMDRAAHPIITALRSGDSQPERMLHFPRRDGRVVWIATAAMPKRSHASRKIGNTTTSTFDRLT